MFQIKADPARNLLTMVFVRRVSADEMKAGEIEVKAQLTLLKPGFRLLTDLSRVDAIDPACLPYISRNMDLFNQSGLSKVVRVIPDPRKDIGLNILSLFHYRRGIKIVTCDTLEEAMNILGE